MKTIPMVLIAALGIFVTLGSASEPTQVPKDKELAKMAEKADTASEHATVAKAYRLRAEAFTKIAEMHEEEVARKQNGPKIGMAAKWPSMSRNSLQREKQRAIEARRSARECDELAALHTQLAVEKGFGGSLEAVNIPAATGRDGGS